MDTNTKKQLPYIVCTLIFLGLILSLNFSLFGGDAFLLWLPALGDYVRGHYSTGGTIFGGQDLSELYGKFPFWFILKSLGLGPMALVNSVYFVFTAILYILSLIIYKGLTHRSENWDKVFVLFYVILSPVITNRVFAGHFNLLFGMVPLLIAIALFYERSLSFVLFCIFSLWCTLSIQSYQILAYHLFYLPIFVVWFLSLENLPAKKYYLLLSGIFLAAFLLNIDVFMGFVNHGKSSQNVRNLVDSMVYTHLIVGFKNLGHLIFSDYNSLTNHEHISFFHELNYPLGFSFIATIWAPKHFRKILVTIFLTILVVYLFAGNVPVFNLLAKLPIIKLFRVPERALMLPVFLVPLIAMAIFKNHINSRTFLFLIFFTILANIIPFYFYLPLGLILIPVLNRHPLVRPALFSLCAAFLFSGLEMRLAQIVEGNQNFSMYENYVRDLDEKFQLSNTTKVIHFESSEAAALTIAANYVGIRTMDGYGHPPKDLYEKVQAIQPKAVFGFGTSILFKDDGKTFHQLINDLGISDVFYVGKNGAMKHVRASDLGQSSH